MKYSYLFFLIINIFVFSKCKKVDKLTQFDMEYNDSVVIPSSTGINLPFNIFTPDIKSNSETTFAVNDTRKDLIEEILITQLDLTLTAPTNADFGFLKSIDIFLSADGLSELKIAWNNNVSSSVGKYLELTTTTADLKEYIKKDQFKLRLYTVTDEIITSDYYIDVHSLFFVDAKILGQ